MDQAVRLLQAHQRLAMTRVMAHVAQALPVVLPYAATGPLELVLYLAWERCRCPLTTR